MRACRWHGHPPPGPWRGARAGGLPGGPVGGVAGCSAAAGRCGRLAEPRGRERDGAVEADGLPADDQPSGPCARARVHCRFMRALVLVRFVSSWVLQKYIWPGGTPWKCFHAPQEHCKRCCLAGVRSGGLARWTAACETWAACGLRLGILPEGFIFPKWVWF